MTNPPGARPGTEAAAAGVVRQATPTPELSSRVKVVNSVSNGAGFIRRVGLVKSSELNFVELLTDPGD